MRRADRLQLGSPCNKTTVSNTSAHSCDDDLCSGLKCTNDALTSTATDWACRSQGGRIGRGRYTSQYAVKEAKAPKPSSEEGDRDREDREKEDTGNVGRRLQKSSDSELLIPALERSDRNHSWKCITERREREKSETGGSYRMF